MITFFFDFFVAMTSSVLRNSLLGDCAEGVFDALPGKEIIFYSVDFVRLGLREVGVGREHVEKGPRAEIILLFRDLLVHLRRNDAGLRGANGLFGSLEVEKGLAD